MLYGRTVKTPCAEAGADGKFLSRERPAPRHEGLEEPRIPIAKTSAQCQAQVAAFQRLLPRAGLLQSHTPAGKMVLSRVSSAPLKVTV